MTATPYLVQKFLLNPSPPQILALAQLLETKKQISNKVSDTISQVRDFTTTDNAVENINLSKLLDLLVNTVKYLLKSVAPYLKLKTLRRWQISAFLRRVSIYKAFSWLRDNSKLGFFCIFLTKLLNVFDKGNVWVVFFKLLSVFVKINNYICFVFQSEFQFTRLKLAVGQK